MEPHVFPLPAWALLTRLGESQIIVPAFAATLAWFRWRLGAARLVAVWTAAVAVAVALTAVTKLAFLGWGLGYAPWDFTGISGHAMFSFALWPVIASALWADALPTRRHLVLVAAYALAAVIAWSRLEVQAHSLSEVISGALVGCAASAASLRWAVPPRSHAPAALMIALALWLGVTPVGAPTSPTHGWVVRIALALSGHEQPYTREQMHLDHDAGRPPTLR